MANPVWGLLVKSQSDSETIEQAIVRLIAEHESDEEAHLGVGDSLQSHKAAEIIDHLAESIIADKIRDASVDFRKLVTNNYMLFSAFESIDGWAKDCDGLGSFTGCMFNVELATGAVSNNASWAYISTFVSGDGADFSKDTFFQTTLQFYSNANQSAYFGIGDFFEEEVTSEWYGFEVTNATVYASRIKAGVKYRTEIAGVSFTVPHVWRAYHDVAVGAIYYYIDNVLVLTATTNLPTLTVVNVFSYYIKTTTTAIKKLMIQDILLSQTK
jgi:hypothetical protein